MQAQNNFGANRYFIGQNQSNFGSGDQQQQFQYQNAAFVDPATYQQQQQFPAHDAAFVDQTYSTQQQRHQYQNAAYADPDSNVGFNMPDPAVSDFAFESSARYQEMQQTIATLTAFRQNTSALLVQQRGQIQQYQNREPAVQELRKREADQRASLNRITAQYDGLRVQWQAQLDEQTRQVNVLRQTIADLKAGRITVGDLTVNTHQPAQQVQHNGAGGITRPATATTRQRPAAASQQRSPAQLAGQKRKASDPAQVIDLTDEEALAGPATATSTTATSATISKQVSPANSSESGPSNVGTPSSSNTSSSNDEPAAMRHAKKPRPDWATSGNQPTLCFAMGNYTAAEALQREKENAAAKQVANYEAIAAQKAAIAAKKNVLEAKRKDKTRLERKAKRDEAAKEKKRREKIEEEKAAAKKAEEPSIEELDDFEALFGDDDDDADNEKDTEAELEGLLIGSDEEDHDDNDDAAAAAKDLFGDELIVEGDAAGEEDNELLRRRSIIGQQSTILHQPAMGVHDQGDEEISEEE